MLSNPPFGVEWKKVEKFIKDEVETQGFNGRFGAGTPRISDGSLLFLQHMLSKMNSPDKGGSRLGIVFNGSPLFTGDAGSGESEIRKWIIENDLLEAVIALPDQLFYNTGISTYIWILTNRKSKRRKGKIRLVNGVSYFEKMRKSLGDKRNLIDDKNRSQIVKLYSMREPDENYKDFNNDDFGYYKITVERPLRSENGEIVLDKNGKPKADSTLRDTENVAMIKGEKSAVTIANYFKHEVQPHVPDAWIDETKTKIGYEIPFTKLFYKYQSPRDIDEICNNIKELEKQETTLMKELLSE
jgi:type I restriction enzyme M protein